MFECFQKAGLSVVSPVQGRCIRIEEVADTAFASKTLGDGFAVIPTGETVVAPVDGEVIAIAKTKHAIGFRTKKRAEILVHVGIDTVKLNGEGFVGLVEAGSFVKAGTPVLRFDAAKMAEHKIDMTTITVFTEGFCGNIAPDHYGKDVSAGERLTT